MKQYMNQGIRPFTFRLAAMFVMISTPVFAQVVPLDGGALLPPRITITNQPGQQFDPHVDGDLAVYSTATFAAGTGLLTETIEYYRFSTGVRSTIPSPPGVQTADLLSDVDQGRIAFTRIFPGGSGRVAIMLFDTATGTLQELMASLPDSRRWAPAMGAQTVAFVDEQLAGDGSGEIMVLDLATSMLTRLTTDTVVDFFPAVSPDGNVVVWQRCATNQNCDIYGATRSGGAWSVRALATTAFYETSPDTNGVDVVFERDNFNGLPNGTNIVTVPINGGLETELEMLGEQYNPSIRGSFITFESRVGFGKPDMYLYDLVSNKFFQITATPDVSEQLNDVTVLPTGDVRLVWQGITNYSFEEADIYAATFTVPTTNTAPTAVAGPNQRTIPGGLIHLNGNGSFDNNTPTNLLLYAWTFVSVPAGSAATLTGGNTMTPSFTPDVSGDYVVRLVVTDQDALSSPPSLVTIGENPAPTSDAGPDQLVIVGHLVALSGAGADPDGDPLTYAWDLTGVPAGSSASLSSSTLPNATFVADQPGVYTAQFTVSDLFGPGVPDGVRITATTATGYAESLVQQASSTILGLPTSAVTNKGNQNALTQFLSHVIVALQSGDLATARQRLAHAIARTDGCALRATPDGNGPSRDWITTCAAQSQVYPLLIDALAAITP